MFYFNLFVEERLSWMIWMLAAAIDIWALGEVPDEED
jgi:hypothetical protein